MPEVDIYRAAHLMMYEYGNDAELEAARCANKLVWRGDRETLVTWFKIWRAIVAMRQTPTGLPH